MAVTVKVFGLLRGITGPTVVVEGPVETVADLIDRMSSRHGAKVKEELLDEQGNLDWAYLVSVEGQRLNSLSARIKDGDEIVITSMLAGG